MRALVERGRAYRTRRNIEEEHTVSDASVEGAVALFALDDRASAALIRLARAQHLTGRGIVRVCRIARTIADIDEAPRVSEAHVLEAAMFRGGVRMKACDRHFELHPDDELYPAQLRDLSDPPRTLFCIGNPEVLSTPSLAVIGSRRATPYGLTVAEMAATVAAESGVTVVSGGAIGCDQAAGNARARSGRKACARLRLRCGRDLSQAVRAARPPRARCRRSRRGDRAVGHRPQALCLPQAQPHHRRARARRMHHGSRHPVGHVFHRRGGPFAGARGACRGPERSSRRSRAAPTALSPTAPAP